MRYTRESVSQVRAWHVRSCIVAILLCGLTSQASAEPRPPLPAQEKNNITFKAPWSGETLGTGARRPTEEEWEWGEKNLRRTERVLPNDLAFVRINEERKKKGLRPLQSTDLRTVSVGEEVPSSTTGSLTDSSIVAPSSVPSYVDNSSLKYFPPIRSQGSLGSCAQFSAVYYTLTHMTALARDWDAKAGGDTKRFSPKWTYNMLNGGANVGSWHYDAYAIAQKHGLASWAEFPYDTNYKAWSLNPQTWRNAINYRSYQSGKILDVDGAGLDQVKQLLLNGYVLNFATYISNWVWDTVGDDPNSLSDDPFIGKKIVRMVNGTTGGHAMTIVGYNDDLWLDGAVDGVKDGIVDPAEKGALRIANSWGTGWNEAGYAWVSYQALRTRNPAATNEGFLWYDEATWATARSSYTPKLLAEFSASHLTRNQLRVDLGIGAISSNTPTTTWTPARVLSYAGGAFAFDGNTTEIPATFYFDFSDLAPATAGAQRYFLSVRDSTTGNPLSVQSFALLDLTKQTSAPSENAALSLDASQKYSTVDYDFGSGLIPPTAVISVTSSSGSIPLVVSFDASRSSDAQGSITNYVWDFGDGSTGTGQTIQHTYSKAGTFLATLTVTNSSGAQASATQTITAIDPNVVAAPTGLSATVSGKTVTLRWSDNSNNETGFKIERALKTKVLTYSQVAMTGPNATSFSETLASGTYNYRVTAVNGTTQTSSAPSAIVSVRVR